MGTFPFSLTSNRLIHCCRNKAVSEGAASYHLDHYVRARVSKMTYGVSCSMNYDLKDAEHIKREFKSYYTASGDKSIPDAFAIILPRVCEVLPIFLSLIFFSVGEGDSSD